jgi:pimeloyl-ACP methyl ester carboxylesterase
MQDKVERLKVERGREEAEDYARGLSDLISSTRDRICADNQLDPDSFRVHLVAHSMGGLICRCFLQNPDADPRHVRQLVDKVFTYATPHNGIDVQVVGNIPGFFTRHNADNFSRDTMRRYLDLPPDVERVDNLNGRFDPDRFFCLVGTNNRDYQVAGGWSRRVVGPLSDGLVRIDNAAVRGPARTGETRQAPRAYVYRSHSGHFGIVNSEDGYQNLTRFLFGNVRVDGVLKVLELTLPPDVERAYKAGRRVRASYHFEVVLRVRRARWDLHRRLVAEESAIFREFDEMFPRDPNMRPRHPHLFSAFLAEWATKPGGRSLGFSLDLGVQVPEYQVDDTLWLDDFHQGGYLYRDKINFLAAPRIGERGWRLRYGLDSRSPNRCTRRAEEIKGSLLEDAPFPVAEGDLVFRLPVEQKSRPGIRAQLFLRARTWW